jgi:hypothetical protein
MTSPRSLDTNILLRYLTGDDPARARRSLALLTLVDGGNDPEPDGASGAIRSALG